MPTPPEDERNPFILPVLVMLAGVALQWLIAPQPDGSSWGLFAEAVSITGGAIMLLTVLGREAAASWTRSRHCADD